MRRKKWRGALLAILAAAYAGAQTQTPSAVPAIPDDAAALLSKAVTAYGDGTAHSSTFTQVYTPSGFATSRREAGTVWIQAPQRLRFEYVAPEKKIFTYDAGEGRFYSPDDMQLTIRKLSPDEKTRLPIVFLTRPEELARQYDIQLDAGRAVLLKPRAAGSELAWLKLSISQTGLVEGLAYEDSSGNRTEFRFEEWRTEKARPASDYRITGPKGTRIVEN